jgi:hypothetical protein
MFESSLIKSMIPLLKKKSKGISNRFFDLNVACGGTTDERLDITTLVMIIPSAF